MVECSAYFLLSHFHQIAVLCEANADKLILPVIKPCPVSAKDGDTTFEEGDILSFQVDPDREDWCVLVG